MLIKIRLSPIKYIVNFLYQLIGFIFHFDITGTYLVLLHKLSYRVPLRVVPHSSNLFNSCSVLDIHLWSVQIKKISMKINR